VFIFKRTEQSSGSYSANISRVCIEKAEKYLATLDLMAENAYGRCKRKPALPCLSRQNKRDKLLLFKLPFLFKS
jgi:hypothetical protein